MNLSKFESSLISSSGEAAQGLERGFFSISAIDRFLNKKGLREEIDIFIIDTSPSLGLLNKVIFLGVDYFITPLMPDAFSVQGIKNLGSTFSEWKYSWKELEKVMAKRNNISSSNLLDGEGLFLGYIINSYNQYGNKPIKINREWIAKIPEVIKKYLSEKHCKNGLVEKSWKNSLAEMKDYGKLSPLSQRKNKAIFNLTIQDGVDNAKGSIENLETSNKEFTDLFKNIESLLYEY